MSSTLRNALRFLCLNLAIAAAPMHAGPARITTSDISFHDKNWGQHRSVTIVRATPEKIPIMLVFELKPNYRRFVAVAGIDDEMKDFTQSSVVFEVWIDGKQAGKSPVMRPGDCFYFNMPIPSGSKSLRLLAGDHTDWVNAGFMTILETKSRL